MGKARFLIKKAELQKEIEKLEAVNTYVNQAELFDAVAKTQWATSQPKSDGTKKPVTAAVVGLRVKEFGLSLKTPKGRKGGFAKGVAPTKGDRASKVKKKNGYLTSFNQIKYNLGTVWRKGKRVPNEPRMKLINQVFDKGSLKSAVRLTCIECCCGQVEEAKKCTVYGCPLWPVSPFTGLTFDTLKGLTDGEVDEVDEEEKD